MFSIHHFYSFTIFLFLNPVFIVTSLLSYYICNRYSLLSYILNTHVTPSLIVSSTLAFRPFFTITLSLSLKFPKSFLSSSLKLLLSSPLRSLSKSISNDSTTFYLFLVSSLNLLTQPTSYSTWQLLHPSFFLPHHLTIYHRDSNENNKENSEHFKIRHTVLFEKNDFFLSGRKGDINLSAFTLDISNILNLYIITFNIFFYHVWLIH